MKRISLILVTIILLIGLEVHSKRRCIHDQITKNVKLQKIDDIDDHRILQTSSYGPIRFHYVYNTTDISSNQALGKNIIKMMQIIKSFWEKTIQVNYKSALSFNLPAGSITTGYSCLNFIVPSQIITTPVPNADYGVLIQARDDGDSGVTAYSYPCAYSAAGNNPLWGLLHWNKFYMTFDPLSFQQNLHIGIHQMTHNLGFTQLLYSFYKTGSYITTNKGSYITGPYINKQVTRQYGCPNPPGMILQSNGGSGTALSHWSRKAANNQFMTASVSTNNPTISFITLALLEQTGFYRKIYKTFGRFINFGYKKGCQMLDNFNCSSRSQYCQNVNQLMCDYDRTALGYCRNDTLSACLYVKYYVNFICINPNYSVSSLNAPILNTTSEAGGERSRCFVSDLHVIGTAPSKYAFRCYEVICSATMKTLTIRIGSTFGFCLFPNQVITVTGYNGSLSCPTSFQAVCAVTRCSQECNANGVCVSGKCLCGPNYMGQACEQLSSLGTGAKQDIFLSSLNNNCLIGSYLTIFGDCQQCQSGCASCNSKQCLLCFDGSLPSNEGCAL